MDSLASHYERLTADDWRRQTHFSESVDKANHILFSSSNEENCAKCVNEWISKNQPCLFGRSAARLGLITYCILGEPDLRQGDQHVRDRIQASRLKWTRAGLEGASSAFVIMVISPTIALARPDSAMRDFARRLCELYLLDDIQLDAIHMDEIFLQIPGSGAILRWKAGINYFSAHGDGRWWQDHRIPGGMALSINSVGHMARSGALSKVLSANADVLELGSEEQNPAPIDSLEKALTVAMQTIQGATDGISGKATWLLPDSGQRPFSLPPKLQSFDCREYRGFYHTDFTLPSDYFRPDVERPNQTQSIPLDFTYLFEKNVNNPAQSTMGSGVRIRDAFDESKELSSRRRQLFEPEEVSVHESARLAEALKNQSSIT